MVSEPVPYAPPPPTTLERCACTRCNYIASARDTGRAEVLLAGHALYAHLPEGVDA